MHHYDGAASKSVTVLDDCSFHHAIEVMDPFEQSGIGIVPICDQAC